MITTLFLSYAVLFGLAVGSFLNVVVLRYHTGKTLLGRSSCASCAHRLAWYDLFPLVSFLWLRGRCRYCHAKISLQYPLVELATALLYFLATVVLLSSPISLESVTRFIFLLLAIPLLVAIFVYDILHKIIPDGLAFGFIAIGLLVRIVEVVQNGFTPDTLLNLSAGPLLFLPFFLFWFLSKGTWMGFGDAKLALGMGWFLGLLGGFSAILFGFWVGALWGITAILLSKFSKLGQKGLTLKSEVPFAPFLIFGVLAVEFFGFSISMFMF